MKRISNFPDYTITCDGRVWSFKTNKWLRPQKNSRGYLQFTLSNDHLKKIYAAHRLVLETYIGPCPKGMECRHLNGNRQDNRLDNLKWGTHSENQQDAVRHGTHYTLRRYGEQHPQAKTSNKNRRLIIYQYMTGLFSQTELGKLFNLDRKTINSLINGESWPFINAIKIRKAIYG